MSEHKLHFSQMAHYYQPVSANEIALPENTEFFHVSMTTEEFLRLWFPELFPLDNKQKTPAE